MGAEKPWAVCFKLEFHFMRRDWGFYYSIYFVCDA